MQRCVGFFFAREGGDLYHLQLVVSLSEGGMDPRLRGDQAIYKRKTPYRDVRGFFARAKARIHSTSMKLQTLASCRRSMDPRLREEKPHAEMRWFFCLACYSITAVPPSLIVS